MSFFIQLLCLYLFLFTITILINLFFFFSKSYAKRNLKKRKVSKNQFLTRKDEIAADGLGPRAFVVSASAP